VSDLASVRVSLKRVDLEGWVSSDLDVLGSPFFRALEQAARRPVLEASSARRFTDGSTLFQQGDPEQSLFVVIRGRVQLSAAQQHQAVELGILEKGGVFGEHEAIDACESRCYSAISLGEVDVIEMPRWIIQQVLAAQPTLLGYLRELDSQRRAHLAEMATFLGRW
jgi:CRP/FNR family cyclic AMP-dependent transcriptional regulator